MKGPEPREQGLREADPDSTSIHFRALNMFKSSLQSQLNYYLYIPGYILHSSANDTFLENKESDKSLPSH